MKKIIVVALSVVFLVGVFAVVAPVQAASLSEVQKQLQSLLGQIKQMQAQNQSAVVIDAVSSDETMETSSPTTTSWCFTFKKNLRMGNTGRQVSNLQTALQKEGYSIDKREINNKRFGDSTKSAVIGFQEKHSLVPAAGYFGTLTRAQLNQLYGCGGTSSSSSSSSAWSSSSSSSSATSTPTITVISPNGGEKWEIGKSYEIKWNTFGWSSDGYVSISLYPMFGGDHAILLTPNDGTEYWTVPSQGISPGNNFIIKIHCPSELEGVKGCPHGQWPITEGVVYDQSDAPFSIVGTSTIRLPHIDSISPSSGTTGTKAEIHGVGFLAGVKGNDNNIRNIVKFGPISTFAELPPFPSGGMITFTVPKEGPSSCSLDTGTCTKDLIRITPGIYDIKVINPLGESNSVNFEVTATTASSTVIVKPGIQPVATLAVGNAIIPFTNFTVDPQGALTTLVDLNVVRTGLGNDGAFREIVLIAQPSAGVSGVDEYRIIARAKFGSKSNKLIVQKFPAFNSPVNLTIAGVMNDDLSNYAGQVAGLSVDDIVVYQDGQGLFSPTGSRVIGASHTINNSLKIGNLWVATHGGATSFNHLEIRNSTIEDIVVEKLVLTGKWSGYVKIKETGESFQCQTSTLAVVSCNFYGVRAAGGIVLGKGVTRTLEFDKSADLILGTYGDPLDAVVAKGMIYGYQLAPKLGIIGEKGSGLTQNQIDAIIALLKSFGANQSAIDSTRAVLEGK